MWCYLSLYLVGVLNLLAGNTGYALACFAVGGALWTLQSVLEFRQAWRRLRELERAHDARIHACRSSVQASQARREWAEWTGREG